MCLTGLQTTTLPLLIAVMAVGGQVVHAQSGAAVNQRTIPLFLAASDPDREGFARIINHSGEAGEVQIYGTDDAGQRFGPATLSLSGGANAHFNSDDLEFGNVDKGLVSGLGDGRGNWRLELETLLDIEAMAYVRTTEGFVTNMHDLADGERGCWRVPFFNPGSNDRQRSLLRLVNPNSDSVGIRISGRDDQGISPGTEVVLTLAGGEARTLSAREIEEGAPGLTGQLGDGTGKWQLAVAADQPIEVMGLLESPGDNLANLSQPAQYGRGRCWLGGPLADADRSVVEYLTKPLEEGKSPGLFAAILDENGVRAIAADGVRREGSAQRLTVNDLIHIGSNTKAMTAVMLATLVADRTLPTGWRTTIGHVFPELLGEIHSDFHAVTLHQLVTMTGGVATDAEDWGGHPGLPLVERRYALLRENLASAPAGTAGQFLYSNLGYMVAGAMVEEVTGKSWEALMRERLFMPLGMSSAGFGAPGAPNTVEQPWGHFREGGTGPWLPVQFDNDPALGPAGIVHLALQDWAKFIALWLPGKRPAILDRAQLDELITPVDSDYAAGWNVVQRYWAGGLALSHGGSNTVWQTVVWVAPNLNRAYLAAANSTDADTVYVLDGIVEALIGHVLPSGD
ncbi:MAG: serine hydrolase [Gammaproteobacteria bacterium]|nr:serine hydrolase [Gammaproteobacteria bacterium]